MKRNENVLCQNQIKCVPKCATTCHLFTKLNKAVLFYFISLFSRMVSHSEGAAGCCGKFWGRSNLGKNPFSRGRSEVRGWKLGQKRTTGCLLLSPWYHFLTGRLQTASLHLDRWTMLYMSTVVFVLLFVHRPYFALPVGSRTPRTPTLLVFACPPTPPSRPGCFPLQEHEIHAEQTPLPPAPHHPPPRPDPLCLRIFQSLLCCRAFHHARCVLFTQKPRGVCSSRMSKIVADNKGYRPGFKIQSDKSHLPTCAGVVVVLFSFFLFSFFLFLTT